LAIHSLSGHLHTCAAASGDYRAAFPRLVSRSRRAVLAVGRRGVDAVVSSLGMGGWASGASINLVDLVHNRMLNVETHEDDISVFILGSLVSSG